MIILKEGGNIFKDPESGNPLTQRIARNDVDPTLDWVEKLTGLKLKDAKNEEKQIIIRNTFNKISKKIKDWLNEK